MCDPAHMRFALDEIFAGSAPAMVGSMRAMEGVMPRANLWNNGAPRVELDERARDARLRLERVERLFAPHTRAPEYWLRRILVCLSFFGGGSRGDRGRRPPSSRRRDRTPQIDQVRLATCGSFRRPPVLSFHHHATGEGVRRRTLAQRMPRPVDESRSGCAQNPLDLVDRNPAESSQPRRPTCRI